MTVGVLYAVLLAAVGLLSLAASLPPNIVWGRTQLSELRARTQHRPSDRDFAFFTRSPETDQIDAYRLAPDATTGASLLVTPQARPSNLFGLSRTQRAQGPELAILLRAVPPGVGSTVRRWIAAACLDRSCGGAKSSAAQHQPGAHRVRRGCPRVEQHHQMGLPPPGRQPATASTSIAAAAIIDCPHSR